ncbi:hypothetical protein ACIPSA_47130 [Streptomyces sp. NPDC086549]
MFLEAAGITDADDVLDDPQLIDWQGAPAHREWAGRCATAPCSRDAGHA